MKKHIVKLSDNRKTLLAYLKENMDLSSRKAKKLLSMGIKVNGKVWRHKIERWGYIDFREDI